MSDETNRLILPGGRPAMIQMNPIEFMINGIASLSRQFAELQAQLQALYSPDPKAAVQHRASRSDKARLELTLDYNAAVATERRGPRVWDSACLDTRGYTLQCAYVQIEIIRDNVFTDLGDRRLLTVVFEGHAGSPFAELDEAAISSTGRTGLFTVPLLRSDDLSLQTRVALYAADNAQYTGPHPWAQRYIEIKIDVVLASGLSF